MSRLLACPFCGIIPKQNVKAGCVTCHVCQFSIHAPTRVLKDAKAIWNGRACNTDDAITFDCGYNSGIDDAVKLVETHTVSPSNIPAQPMNVCQTYKKSKYREALANAIVELKV